MDNNPRVWKHAVERYNMTLRRWQVATKYREARGIITGVDKLGELKRAYPLFAASPNGNRSVLADLLLEFPPTDESTVQLRQYMDMYDLLLSRYGSEALAYIKDVEFGGFTTLLHSTDPRWTLDMFRMWGGGGQARHYRPVGGGIGEVARLMAEELSQRGVSKMSVAMGITKANRCSKADRKMSGFSKKNGCYRLETWRGSTVFAKHVAFAVPPLALRKIKGDVVADLLATPLLENALPEPAFKAALLFPYAWWEPYLHANETSGFLDAISGSGNCLGQIVPYMGRGSNGEAAIHVAYMAGECVDGHWAHLFHSNGPSEAEWKAHLMRQLKVLFPGFEVPEPLQVVTKYWEEGAWHMQRKTDPYLTSLQILKLSTNPLPGEDVYLINEAFGLRRGWMEASFESAEAVLRVRFLNDTSSWSEGDYVEIEGKVVGGSDRVEIQGDISSIVKSTPPFPFDFTIQPGPFVARKPLVRQPGACTTK